MTGTDVLTAHAREAPDRIAVIVDDSGGMLDVAVRIQNEQLAAFSRYEPGHSLRRDRVEPREPVGSGHADR